MDDRRAEERKKVWDTYTEDLNQFLNGKKLDAKKMRSWCLDQQFNLETNPAIQAELKAFISAQELTSEEQKKVFKIFPNRHVKPWSAFVESIKNYDESKDFHCSIFNRRFPIGTINYIGARPARGKTTMLVNIALDAIRNGKQVVFVTAEETTKQILMRFVYSDAYASTIKDDSYMKERVLADDFNQRISFYEFIKTENKPREERNGWLTSIYEPATKRIKSLMEDGKLVIYEAYGSSWDELTKFIGDQEGGTVVLIDYIQHLKSPDNIISQSRQVQIQEISHCLADIAGVNDLIIVSGAQFNRPKDTNEDSVDRFTETSFREAGDIEQDGHILIGIGKDPNTKPTPTFFFSCMKDREHSPDNGKYYKLEHEFKFSFMRLATDADGNRIRYHQPSYTSNGDNKASKATKQKEEAIETNKIGSFGRK